MGVCTWHMSGIALGEEGTKHGKGDQGGKSFVAFKCACHLLHLTPVFPVSMHLDPCQDCHLEKEEPQVEKTPTEASTSVCH